MEIFEEFKASCPKHLCLALKVLYLHDINAIYIKPEINDKNKMAYLLRWVSKTESENEGIRHEINVMIS